MPKYLSFCCWLVVFVSGTGCAAVPRETLTGVTVPAPIGLVLVADGAGGGDATTAAFHQAMAAEGIPLSVERVRWCHGSGRVIADQIDGDHARERGRELAGRIVAYRAASPAAMVYLVGHSAGSTTVLAAAEALPPDSVDRIVLLAPSVSADHDLRPALRCARYGVDVFCSRRDWFFLGICTGIFGTVEGRWQAAAGRVGFRPKVETPEDSALYARLQQHPWHPAVQWTGNEGGHCGGHEVAYLRAYVLPLFALKSHF